MSRFFAVDYNPTKGLMAAGGDTYQVAMFPGNMAVPSSSNTYGMPLICLYDDTDEMSLLWAKTYEISIGTISLVRFSPNGQMLAFQILMTPPIIGILDSKTGAKLFFK